MKSAVPVFLLRTALLLAAAVVLSTAAVAQSDTASKQGISDEPPVRIIGWRYEKGLSGRHTFYCAAATCPPNSTVTYSLLPPAAVNFDQYRRHAEMATQQLQQDAPPGTRVELLGVNDDSRQAGDVSLRLFKNRRLIIGPDGAKKYTVQGVVLGSRYAVSLTSSSPDEKAADGQLMLFSAPLWLIAEGRTAESGR